MDIDIKSTVSFLKDQLTKSPMDSKKYLATVMGLAGVGIMFGASYLAVILWPAVAAAIQGVAQIAITGLSGIVVAFLGVQGVSDYRATSALESAVNKEEKP
jgi:hypothetical protein